MPKGNGGGPLHEQMSQAGLLIGQMLRQIIPPGIDWMVVLFKPGDTGFVMVATNATPDEVASCAQAIADGNIDYYDQAGS